MATVGSRQKRIRSGHEAAGAERSETCDAVAAPPPDELPATAPKAVDAPDDDPPHKDLVKRPPRLNIEVEVDLHSDSCFYSGLTENLSEGGLFVATYQLHPIGTRLDVTLTLEGMPPIEARTEVRWIREPRAETADHAVGMGLAFVALHEADRATIQAFMQCRSPLLMEGV